MRDFGITISSLFELYDYDQTNSAIIQEIDELIHGLSISIIFQIVTENDKEIYTI
jgi:hypothetical protein